jgi:very-short-patch-repair endonuclease
MTVDPILALQSGVISRAQALAAGLSRDTIDHRVRARRWRPLYPAVYLAADHRFDEEVRVRAALLWAGDGALLSGRSAAWWYGLLPDPPPAVGVTVGRRRRLRSRVDVDVRRRDVPGLDRAVHRSLAVTALPLTVLEAAVELGDAGVRFLDTALRRKVPFADVHAAYCRNLGAAGSATARRMLAAATERSTSAARRELVVLLRGSGASGWTDKIRVDGHPIDVAFPAARVAVLVSGWAVPTEPLEPDVDARRRAALLGRDWTVLRFTWHDIVERPQAVLAEIARHVAHGMAELSRAACR